MRLSPEQTKAALDRYAAQNALVEQRLSTPPQSLETQLAETLAASNPDASARITLKDVEAISFAENVLLNGSPVAAGEAVLILPAKPPRGFAPLVSLQSFHDGEVEKQSDGTWKATEPLAVAGHRYAEGDVICEWPDKKCPLGFINPAAALSLIREGRAKPVQLIAE